MGKFYDAVKQAFPGLDEKKSVPSTAGVSKKTMERRDNTVLTENGKPVSVGQALSEIDAIIEQIPVSIQKFYYPLKQPGGPLAATFQRFLMVITEDAPQFRRELEIRVKAAAAGDWHNVVSALCTENINTSPSYRAILLSKEGDINERHKIHTLAVEFNREGTSDNRKTAIGREIAEITWQNILSSSVAVMIESGIGMDIDASGQNRIAAGAGGSRASAPDVAWQAIAANAELKSPLIAQVGRCSEFLAQGVGMYSIASTVVSMAEKAGKTEDKEEAGDYFYPQVETLLQESRSNVKKSKEINKALYDNQRVWAPLTQKPEASFHTSDKTAHALPHAVQELEEHLREQLKQKQPQASSSSGMADKDKHLKK